MKNQIEFNSSDWQGMINLMDEYGDSTEPFYGVTEDGEEISISIFKDKIVTVVNQSNGWVRKNIYYKDQSVDNEELFEGKWK